MSTRRKFSRWTLLVVLLMLLGLSSIVSFKLSTSASASASVTPITNYTGPSLRLPWQSGSYGISQAYNCNPPYGDHTTNTKDQFAIDFAFGGNHQVQLVAVFSGIVHYGTYDGNGYGNSLWITSTDGNWKAVYAHLGTSQTNTGIQVANGQQVTQGQGIAMSGWTGYVLPPGPDGAHLHFSLRYKTSELTSQYDGDPVMPEPMSGYGAVKGGNGISFGDYGRCGSRQGSFNPSHYAPGGWWNTPPTPQDGTYTTGSTLTVSAHAHDYTGSGLDYVNITWLDTGTYNNQTWTKQTQTFSTGVTDSDFSVTIPVPVTNFTNDLLVSFDVRAKNGTSQLAPNGVHRYCLPGKSSCLPYTVVGGSGGANTDGVLVCSNANYTGTCASFGVGSVSDLSVYSLSGNISSIQVPSSFTLVLYDQTGLTGQPGTFNQSVPDLSATTNWNDRAKSLQVQRKLDTTCSVPTGSNGILLYRDTNYGTNGGCYLATASITDLGTIGYTRISSLQFVGSFINTTKVTVYTDANYGTVCSVYTLNQSDLRACAQQDIVSMKIENYTPPAQANNLASSAMLDQPDAGYAVDGSLNTEWMSGGNSVPLGFVFNTSQTIQSVVVFDRKQNNPDNNQINKVQLVFSDGTVVNNIDMTSGGPRCAEIDFPAKTVNWVNVVPTDASGYNGFSEVQIFDTAGTPSSQNNCVMKFSVTPVSGSGPAPLVVCPAPWNCGDIGNPALAGSHFFNAGNWTIQGAGSDIWNAQDQFHYVWQVLPGDGVVSADVLSQTNTNGWAKAGVMFRQNTTTDSAFYMVALTPGNGITVQYRTSQGASAQMNAQFAGSSPVYVQATRTGNTFTAATSSDGGTWTPVSGSSVTLTTSGTILAGLEVDSDDVSNLSTVTFSNAQVSSTSSTPPPTPTPTPTPTATPTATPTPSPTPTGTQPFVVYDESLAANWGDWSWSSTINWSDTSHPNTGSKDCSWTVTSGYGGLALHLSSGFNTAGYTSFTFALRATQANQKVQVSFYNSAGNTGTPVQLDSYGGTPGSGAYTVYTIPISAFQSTGIITGILIQDTTGSAQPPMYMDTMKFI